MPGDKSGCERSCCVLAWELIHGTNGWEARVLELVEEESGSRSVAVGGQMQEVKVPGIQPGAYGNLARPLQCSRKAAMEKYDSDRHSREIRM